MAKKKLWCLTPPNHFPLTSNLDQDSPIANFTVGFNTNRSFPILRDMVVDSRFNNLCKRHAQLRALQMQHQISQME